MELMLLPHPFVVCQLQSVPLLSPQKQYWFLSITPDEISLVCPANEVPKDTIVSENGWRALKIAGVLDFALIGILADISGILAKQKISIFAVSTYNTDYVLLKEDKLLPALDALQKQGYSITQ